MTTHNSADIGPRARLLAALETLDRIDADNRDSDTQQKLLLTVRETVAALAESLGECQVELPYASMYMVRRPDGAREWCCTHDPAHCDPA